jgi:hypothetical protein
LRVSLVVAPKEGDDNEGNQDVESQRDYGGGEECLEWLEERHQHLVPD